MGNCIAIVTQGTKIPVDECDGDGYCHISSGGYKGRYIYRNCLITNPFATCTPDECRDSWNIR